MKNIQYGTEFLDQLKDRVHDLYDENVKLKEEIERLKEEYVMLQNASDEVEEKLQARIDKAIEYLTKCNYNDLKFTNRTYDILLNILKGVDKE